MATYFDNLALDYTIEMAKLNGNTEDIMRNEVFRRLMFIIKAGIDEKPFLISTSTPNREHVLANEPMLTYLGYTQEEMQSLTGEDIFDERDYPMAHSIGENNLSSPYIARIKKENGNRKFCKIQGLSISADGISWRYLIFLELDVTLAV